MNKLQKLGIQKALGQMSKTGEQSKAALQSAIKAMKESGQFTDGDIQNLQNVHRYLGDVNKMFSNLQQGFQK